LQVHAYIISSLKKDMPAVFGKEAKKKELIKNLDALYASLQRVRRQHVIFNSNSVLADPDFANTLEEIILHYFLPFLKVKKFMGR
jgi:hypothetical protein